MRLAQRGTEAQCWNRLLDQCCVWTITRTYCEWTGRSLTSKRRGRVERGRQGHQRNVREEVDPEPQLELHSIELGASQWIPVESLILVDAGTKDDRDNDRDGSSR